jgi:hypothetical protein
MGKKINPDSAIIYQIKLDGQLGKEWSMWFNQWTLSVDEAAGKQVTTLTGAVPDQAALRGVLNRIWDLNLDVISVLRLPVVENS